MPSLQSSTEPVADTWGWQQAGLCRSRSSELFFHPEGERGTAKRTREERAKEVCRNCPVIAECRAHALTVQEPYGVWGGLTEEERTAILQSPRDEVQVGR